MALNRKDRDFRHDGITRLEFKQLDMDRVLTALLARLWHGGLPSRISRSADLPVDAFVDEFLEHPESFAGFDRDITRRWLETHLLDLVNRGKPTQAIAGPRPLHGFTYRFRNAKRSRPYGADEQLYEMISAARGGKGTATLQYLRDYFFTGIDAVTQSPTDTEVDVETQALLHLATVRSIEDRADTSKPRTPHPPLCVAAADLLADDIVRLLFHQRFVPRSVMVDYLKILLAFHLALYHLRILNVVPSLVSAGAFAGVCGSGTCPADLESAASGCGYELGIFCDVAGVPGTGAALLAERSAQTWYGRIPGFVRAAYAVKKLDEFAENQAKLGKLRQQISGARGIGEALTLQGKVHSRDRENYFEMRVRRLVEDSGGAGNEVDSEITKILSLGLDHFNTYVEIVTAYRGDYYRRYITETFDTMLLKNRDGALIAQPRGGARRFILDSRLIEVLLQLNLLAEGGPLGFHTASVRVDEFVSTLRNRYGLYIDRLPADMGPATITDGPALRANETAFRRKLREIGFFPDLSDAYLTQTITPRYVVERV